VSVLLKACCLAKKISPSSKGIHWLLFRRAVFDASLQKDGIGGCFLFDQLRCGSYTSPTMRSDVHCGFYAALSYSFKQTAKPRLPKRKKQQPLSFCT
jgi:hypothetical protein